MNPRQTADLSTPALIIDVDALERNLSTMSARHPGAKLRPHAKAHKCTEIARLQLSHSHKNFTCATPREVIGMATAGIGSDLLLANEVLDADRLAAIAKVSENVHVTIAVDSHETIDAAVRAGLRDVLIDVNVGLPRCGVAPELAGQLADTARKAGMTVRGVMGYEGHLMMVSGDEKRKTRVAESMKLLTRAAKDVGGEIISAGGTGTWDMHDETGINELQAGSYALMDTHYAQLKIPFVQACFVLGTVISRSKDLLVIDVGLKSLSTDHGNPSVDGYEVLFCSDEHTTLVMKQDSGLSPANIGEKLLVRPSHIDPTMSMHSVAWATRADEILECWQIDLRGW